VDSGYRHRYKYTHYLMGIRIKHKFHARGWGQGCAQNFTSGRVGIVKARPVLPRWHPHRQWKTRHGVDNL